MAQIIDLQTMRDSRGALTVIEKILPFSIKRIFYIYDFIAPRGGHRHKKTRMALIALRGNIEVEVRTPKEVILYQLNSPDKCLILNPEDWHIMNPKNSESLLLVLASHEYDAEDYIRESYD